MACSIVLFRYAAGDRTCSVLVGGVFFFKQKTAYEMRISDWSSDVCSSDLLFRCRPRPDFGQVARTAGARIDSGTIRRPAHPATEIGRASRRERVSVRVDVGGSRISKKKQNTSTSTLRHHANE